MKSNNFGYLMKEGFLGLFVHGFMSFAAICVTVACLLIVGMFSLLLYDINVMVEKAQQENRIMAYVDETYSDAEARSVGSKLNMIENVQNAEFVSREEALEDFAADHSDNDFTGIDATTFRHRFVITLVDNALADDTVEQIESVTGVAKVNYDPKLANGFATLQSVMSVASVVIISVLLVVSLLIISNTVKLAMYDRRDEIAIMKMVGATNGFIRFPFVIEGFFLGIISAVVAFLLEWGVYDLLVDKITASGLGDILTLVPFQEVLPVMIATFCAAGLFVGIVGSVVSIRKFLKV